MTVTPAKILLACLLVTAWSVAPSRPVTVDVSGTWLLTVTSPGGAVRPTLVLEQESGRLRGTYASTIGQVTALSGVVSVDSVIFRLDPERLLNANVVYKAVVVDADTIRGHLVMANRAAPFFGVRVRQP